MSKKLNKKNKYKLIILLNIIEKIIDHKAFRPVSIVILTSFLLFNGGTYVKYRIFDYHDQKKSLEKTKPVKIQISEKGKVLDFNQVQIVEKQVRPGDNILGFLIDVGVNESDSFAILKSLKKVFDPHDLVVGNRMIAKYRARIDYIQGHNKFRKIKREIDLTEFKLLISNELEYVVKYSDGEFKAKKVQYELVKKIVRHVGKIENGLFIDATDVGASPNAVMNMISLYGYSVDFQRDIRKGDEFEILVERFFTKKGRRVKDGNIIYASLTTRGSQKEMYAYRRKNGSLQYFDSKGYSVKRSLLRTPVNGARISSRFGYRRHPVLGYSKLHKGVDFAAPRGTPVFAAGDGVITYRARYGSFGNFVKIRHNSRYETAYAHLQKFNRRFRRGSRVKQGDVIAYVGTTGRSTGPHLHFEVRYRGKAINPAKVKAVSSNRLKGSKLKSFKIERDKINKIRKNSPTNVG